MMNDILCWLSGKSIWILSENISAKESVNAVTTIRLSFFFFKQESTKLTEDINYTY